MSFRLALSRILAGTSPHYSAHQTICWGTRSEAKRICPRAGNTRRWAHAWVRRHMEPLPLGRLEVLDAGSGLSNRLLDWYRPRVKHAFLVDFLLDSRSEGNTTVVRGDLEQGIPLADASVDLVTSVSSIEHLSRAGQILFLGEAQRVLRPGGLVVMTVSYSLGLDKHKLEVLASNPVLLKAGFSISAALNLRHMLEAAPGLAPPETPVWSSFPGYEGFSEQALFENRDVLLDTVHIDDRLPEAAEVNSLAVRWAEIGIFLTNSPGGISP